MNETPNLFPLAPGRMAGRRGGKPMGSDFEILESVRHNCAKDAESLDGMPLNGKTMGTMFGNVLAAIDTLAAVMQRQVKQQRLLHDGD